MGTAIRHGNETDKVSEPGQLGLLQLRMLMPEMIHIPGFISDHQIVFLLFQNLLEDHEIGDQDFIHISDRLESIQIMFAGLRLNMVGFVGQQGRGGMQGFVRGIQKPGHRILGQPIHLNIGMAFSQLLRNGQIPSGMTKSDGGR